MGCFLEKSVYGLRVYGLRDLYDLTRCCCSDPWSSLHNIWMANLTPSLQDPIRFLTKVKRRYGQRDREWIVLLTKKEKMFILWLNFQGEIARLVYIFVVNFNLVPFIFYKIDFICFHNFSLYGLNGWILSCILCFKIKYKEFRITYYFFYEFRLIVGSIKK